MHSTSSSQRRAHPSRPVGNDAAVRVYLPMTMTELAAATAAGSVGPAPVDGFAVTPGLREWFAEGDDEELEYAAQARAAAASIARLVADPSAPRRRVVLAVDVDDASVTDADGLDTGAVVVDAAVPSTSFVSAVVDDVAAIPDVTRAVEDPDDADAASDVEDHQLLWFAVQELTDL